jgi:hypothetical protein
MSAIQKHDPEAVGPLFAGVKLVIEEPVLNVELLPVL